MPEGAALVDVAIDPAGVCATSRPTTHASPTYVDEGVVHYCVTNMPGAVRTASFALNNATLPHVLQLAAQGVGALWRNGDLRAGLNVSQGRLTHSAVAAAFNLPCTAADDLFV